MRIEATFVDVVEKGGKLVVLLLGNGVVAMVVATRALEGEAHEGGPEGLNPVVHIFHPVFLRHRAALVRLPMKAVEGRRNALVR